MIQQNKKYAPIYDLWRNGTYHSSYYTLPDAVKAGDEMVERVRRHNPAVKTGNEFLVVYETRKIGSWEL